MDRTVDSVLADDDDALRVRVKRQLAKCVSKGEQNDERTRSQGSNAGGEKCNGSDGVGAEVGAQAGSTPNMSGAQASTSEADNGGHMAEHDKDEQEQELYVFLCDELLRLNGARVFSSKDVASIWSWATD